MDSPDFQSRVKLVRALDCLKDYFVSTGCQEQADIIIDLQISCIKEVFEAETQEEEKKVGNLK